jgi:hypothetical protein
VSLYLSTGGGVIGGGQQESVRTACVEMLSITNQYAEDFIAACEPVSTFAMPGEGEVLRGPLRRPRHSTAVRTT